MLNYSTYLWFRSQEAYLVQEKY